MALEEEQIPIEYQLINLDGEINDYYFHYVKNAPEHIEIRLHADRMLELETEFQDNKQALHCKVYSRQIFRDF